MKRLLALVTAAALVGCGAQAPEPPSRLAEAVAAYKAGNWDDLAAAREGADAALDEILAAAPADDPCSGDILRVGLLAMEAAGMQALDARSVMSMSEEARFVFVANQVGQGPRAEPDPRLRAFDACTSQDFNRVAVRDLAGARAARNAVARPARALLAWQDDLKAEHGEEFEPRMRAASRTLRQNGFEVSWPARIAEVAAARS